ncbi:FERRY endosomal RAB5 effector complex subunit 3-like isoform X2 [Dysidea avara]|uniref:FERRY endosomal RAB5 effector complex subunit 3-like isoform X2 n=1 Tax=Dysidea avara TaxID=196820 RepID=UPI00332896C4
MSLGAHWASELSQLQETQKREYRDFVVKLHDDMLNDELGRDRTQSLLGDKRAVSSGSIIPQEEGYTETPPEPRMEESFTIHLGSQLKTMHNLRMLSCNVLDLCRHSTTFTGGARTFQPHKLQTAMSLYSEKLSALILLVDSRINTLGENKRVFASITHQSTDFHFADIDVQINAIRKLAQTTKQENKDSTTISPNGILATDENGLDVPSSLNSSSLSDFSNDGREHGYNLAAFRGGDAESGGSELGPAGFLEHSESVMLSPGDVYVTRHSNLSEVHVIFHLVTDPLLSVSDIPARHSVMVGLRNCLHAASHHDIHTITIPLLMVHDMSPEMTINWCLKRAELVMKCVKGFMMESTSWGGADARTIQFVVPPGLSDELFVDLCEMLPRVFRMASTRNLTKR